nr:hypothetical protein [Nakamurella alba]
MARATCNASWMRVGLASRRSIPRAGIDSLAEHDELVTGHAAKNIGTANGVAQSPCHLFENGISGLVAEGVEDGLETVEINEHHSGLMRLAASALQCPVDQLMEQPTVRQPGEWVVQRMFCDLPVSLAGLGPVRCDAITTLETTTSANNCAASESDSVNSCLRRQ